MKDWKNSAMQCRINWRFSVWYSVLLCLVLLNLNVANDWLPGCYKFPSFMSWNIEMMFLTGYNGVGWSFDSIWQRGTPQYHTSGWNGRESCKYSFSWMLNSFNFIIFCSRFCSQLGALSLFPPPSSKWMITQTSMHVDCEASLCARWSFLRNIYWYLYFTSRNGHFRRDEMQPFLFVGVGGKDIQHSFMLLMEHLPH